MGLIGIVGARNRLKSNLVLKISGGTSQGKRFGIVYVMTQTHLSAAPMSPSVRSDPRTFRFNAPTQLVVGPGRLSELGGLATTPAIVGQRRPRRVLMVVDRGVRRAGHAEPATRSLTDAGLEVALFDDFSENPTASMVDAGVAAAVQCQPDLLVGLGGGSAMDACKAINLVFCCGGQIADYRGAGKATTDLLPMIAIPTTAGTGSEVQSYAIISDDETHIKMPCGDVRAQPAAAILDPHLVMTQPPAVAALTGIDAISHAVETSVTRRRSVVSSLWSREAFRFLASSFETFLRDPSDLRSAASMQWGAACAGMAIEASMLGAAHATANPLTARYGIPHGQAVGLMLPAVVELNAATEGSQYGELVRSIDPTIADPQAAPWLVERIQRWTRQCHLATRLRDLDADVDIPACAVDAMSQWTGTFNPVALTPAIVESLYRRVE